MRRDAIIPLSFALLLVSAGCLGGTSQPPRETVRLAAPIVDEPRPPLEGATEPDDFVAPTFASAAIAELVPSFAVPQPLNPVIATLPDGRLFAGTPTCDRIEPAGSDFANRTEQDECQQRILYLSDANGGSWERLNQDPRARIDRRTERPYGHVDVAVDGNGTLFAAMGDAGYNDVFVYRSFDGGERWNATLSNIEPRASRDGGPLVGDGRLAAAGLGRVVVGWRACEQANTSCWLGLKVSFRGGSSWSNPVRFGTHVRALGPFVVGPTGYDVHAAYLEGTETGGDAVLHVLSSKNWGVSWVDEDLGIVVGHSQGSMARESSYGLPVVAPLGDGGLAVAWSDEEAPGGAARVAHVIRYMVRDKDSAWGDPVVLPSAGSARFPWIVGGAGDRFALLYWSGTAPSDLAAQTWDIALRVVDGQDAGSRTLDTVLVERVHAGLLCEGETECLAGNPRMWIEFAEATARPDGRLAFTYPTTSGPTVEWRSAVQDGGSPLFVPPAS